MKKLLLNSILLLCALVAGSLDGWAENQTLTLTQSALGLTGSYTTSTEKTVGGITFVYTDLMKNSADIQAKASTGEIYNKTAFPTKILSVAITHSGTARATTIMGSSDGTNWTQVTSGSGSITGNFSSNNYKYFKITRGSNAAYWTQIVITYEESAPSGTTAAPTITGNTPFYGSTTATITNAASADGANIYYTLNGSDPTTTTSATCFAYIAAFSIDATTTVKAIAKKSTDTNASSVVSKTFTKVTPMTVDEALTAISALANNGTIENQCVRGIVTEVGSLSSGAITYTISDDVAASNSLQIYKGKGLHNANFAAATDIKLGDDVVIYGTLKKYVKNTTTTPEFDEGNYLLYQVSKTAPTFTLSTSAETLSMGTTETVDVTLTTNTDGAITCESSDDDVATVALKSAGVYTITGRTAGTATITIKSALTNHYQPASATVAITVNDTREEAGLSFAEDEEEITWGDAYTGQALANTHSLPVTWSSTDETVATVSSSGVVDVLKAGSTEIKASFAGNATYKSTVVAYTLTVKKAEAGLSYDQTEFEIMVGDDSFVAPTLNNPNSLTVTYSSSNGTVATVDAGTGEITYDENTPGSATITAYFAGNDNYKGGNAKYTINIVDPTVKGSKYNPYTVAEIEGQATATTFGNNIYVTGYIVGSVSSNKCYKETSSLVNTNLLLADTPDISFTEGANVASNTDGLIPVELPTSPSSIRTNWGIKDNPSKLGYKILIKGNAKAYFGTNSIKETSEITAVAVPVTVGASKYAAYCSTYALDFSATEVKAYKAKVDGGKVVLTKVDEVPANTGVILYGDADNYTVPVIASAAAVTENELIGVTTRTLVEWETGGDGKYNYILQSGQFKKAATGGHLKANRAYLHTSYDVTSAGARDYLEFSFEGEEETTGVNEVTTTNRTNEYFDLQGRKVAQPTKGLYIVNGKKVIIK